VLSLHYREQPHYLRVIHAGCVSPGPLYITEKLVEIHNLYNTHIFCSAAFLTHLLISRLPRQTAESSFMESRDQMVCPPLLLNKELVQSIEDISVE